MQLDALEMSPGIRRTPHVACETSAPLSFSCRLLFIYRARLPWPCHITICFPPFLPRFRNRIGRTWFSFCSISPKSRAPDNVGPSSLRSPRRARGWRPLPLIRCRQHALLAESFTVDRRLHAVFDRSSLGGIFSVLENLSHVLRAFLPRSVLFGPALRFTCETNSNDFIRVRIDQWGVGIAKKNPRVGFFGNGSERWSPTPVPNCRPWYRWHDGINTTRAEIQAN